MNPALIVGEPSGYIAHALAKIYGPTCPQHWWPSCFDAGAGFGKLTFWHFYPINPKKVV